MKHTLPLGLLAALMLALAIPCLSQASCKDYRVDGLFIRLACPWMKADLTDTEIIGGFWADSRELKDAAYRDDLEGFATAHDAPWALQYGTADDVWTVLNTSEYRMREVLREAVKEMRSRKMKNTCKLLECRASEAFSRDTCGCGCAQ